MRDPFSCGLNAQGRGSIETMKTPHSSTPRKTPTRELHYDFPGVLIGHATQEEGPTGCTVLSFPNGATAAVDVRGGSAALRESTLLDPLSTWAGADALVFAGGSTYGLEAASGVMQALLEKRGHATGFAAIPSVPAAVVYDFAGRKTSHYPTAQLGRQAYENARPGVALIGKAGAGRNVWVGKLHGRNFSEPGYQGAAFARTPSGYRLLALTVVNALGNITDFNGKTVAGSLDPDSGERRSAWDGYLHLNPSHSPPSGGNTTLSALLTDAPLSRTDLQRLAVMSHSAMARVIEPFHTPYDGDALFALSVPQSTPSVTLAPEQAHLVAELGTWGGRLMCEAVLSGFHP
jgi:L-aminopeptidase/D-esterase-like protein